MSFSDRSDAGRRLAAALEVYRARLPVVLALPRGGVPVAAEVAAALGAPLDLVFVRKIGVPGQPELAMGAVVDGGRPIIVRNEDVIAAVGISEGEFQAVCRNELKEIQRRRQRYLGGRSSMAPSDTLAELRAEADDVICPQSHRSFGAISRYYDDFRQVSDEEVIAVVASFAKTETDAP